MLKKGNQNISLLAPMQSGKTGSIKYLCNTILPKIDFLKNDQTVMFLTSMTDKDLYSQNSNVLECYNSHIIVKKMHEFKLKGLIDVDYNNVSLIVRDEDQYGCGTNSSFDYGFFNNLRKVYPNIPLLSVSATPFDVLDAKNKGYDIEVVHGKRPVDYFGISEMLKDDFIKNLESDYQHFQASDDSVSIISPQIKECYFHLKKFDKGLAIIRTSKTSEALDLKDQLKTLTDSGKFEILVIGCLKECDFGINEGLKNLSNLIERKGKKVILLVINALSAGKDLGPLKEHVKFVIETRKTQLANSVQGLPGRLCGYHANRDIIVYANKSIMKHYSLFENNPDLMYDEEWVSKLYFDDKVKTLTTHTRLKRENKEGIITPILSIKSFEIKDLFKTNIIKELDFLNESSLKKIINCFDKKFYDSESKYFKFGDPDFQVRVASSYKKSKRFINVWSSKLDTNINNVFSKLSKNKYGILISNYPLNHPLNFQGFCGIKVFKSGSEKFVKRLSVTTSYSMYDNELNNINTDL